MYCSTAIAELSPHDLRAILKVSRNRNSQHCVTGMLLYASGSFFQVLEGDEATLTELFDLIASDWRHKNVTKIIHEPIAQRAFGDWTVGFAEIDVSELAHIEGLSDFFQQGNSLTNLQPGRAKKILTAFAQGRWRARLEEGAK